jgi:hypothetical protein
VNESESDAVEGGPVEDGTVEDGTVEGETADDTFDEVRQAAGAVIASLKWLAEATERVVEDPAAFSQIVESGRSVVEAFAGGFAAQAKPSADDDESPNAEGGVRRPNPD